MRRVGEHWVPRCRPRGRIHTIEPCSGEFRNSTSSFPLSARTQTRLSGLPRNLLLDHHRLRRRPVWLSNRWGLLGSEALGRTPAQVLYDLTTPVRRHLRFGV
jgi:hypothetical protein